VGLAVYNGCTTTRIVCRPNCPPGRRTLPAHRVTFGSLEEARAAGYRPCRVCAPDDGPPGPWVRKGQRPRHTP
jgi:methylphosphotriester-DNA--protein-cysteine methyltransferase